jgi:hypothetical protein
MITFNNIVERFEVFATNHFFIKSFSFGSPDDVDLAKFTEFPLMHMVYTGATYDTGTKTYNIEVYILDVPADKSDKVERQREVVSDAEQCAEDIIADIRMGGNIFTFAQDYEVVNATTTPLEEETKNVLSGVLLDLSVAIPYEWDACNAPIDGVSPEGGDEPSYARRGFLRMLTLDGSTDVLSVRTIKVTNGTLTDDGDGVVTLNTGGVETLDDLTDVDIISPDQGDVLSYNSGVQKWMVNGGLQELLARFKASGTGAQMYDTLNDTTKGYIDILANSAKMKVNLSGLTVTEASPGVLSFAVAAGTEGNEVEFEAMTIEGSDALSTIADINFKQGALTYWENATGKIWLRAPNVGNITVLFPSSTGTLALTTDIPNVPVDSVNGQTGVVVLDTGDIDENGNLYYTEARVAANAAVAANTAKVGITPTQASEITANTAKVGITTQQAADITANNAKVGITPTQAGEITANTAKVGVIAGGTSGQALVKASGTDYDTEWADIAIDTQYHDRFATDAETFRSGATDTVELYYTAKADGDGLAESASSDTPTAGKIIRRKIYYSEAAFADPDTGTWVEFTPAPADDASFATVKAALLEYLKARTGGTVPISLKQTWEEVTAAPSFTGLLNETYGSGAEAAYSTRRLNGNVTECMVIRRASDSTTTTIGFDGSGNISEADIETFCTGTSCTVYQWLDQSGNGNHATAPSTGEEPTIYTGGALVKENGKVALDFDGTNNWLDLGTNQLGNTELFADSGDAFSIYQYATIDTEGTVFSKAVANNSSRDYQLYYQNEWASYIRGAFTLTGITEKRMLASFDWNGSSAAATFNGTSQSINIGTAAKSTQDINIGSRSDGGFLLDGKNQEIIVYDSSKSTTDRTDIEENIGDYFTQNTPLLDTYSGASAAYSLRRLSSTYTGDAVEVYNGSSYADIGFNVFGELDTVALAAHCGSNDGFVSKWYDQSGNTNTAAQTATANMPKIYDGTTGVVTENGKPAVQFDGSNDYVSTADFTAEAQPFYFSLVISPDSTALARLIDTNGTDTNNRINVTLDGSTYGINAGNTISGGTTSTTQQLLTADFDTTSSFVYKNGSQIISGDAGTRNIDSIRIGANKNGIQVLNGTMQEVIFYNSDQSSNRTNIEDNINTFYNIYS